jgi:hypothetical protein
MRPARLPSLVLCLATAAGFVLPTGLLPPAPLAGGGAPRVAKLEARNGRVILDGVALASHGRSPDIAAPLRGRHIDRLVIRLDSRTTIGEFLDILHQMEKLDIVTWDLYVGKRKQGRFPNRSCGRYTVDAGVNDPVDGFLEVKLSHDPKGVPVYCLSSGP